MEQVDQTIIGGNGGSPDSDPGPFKISFSVNGVARPKGSMRPINAPNRGTILIEEIQDGPGWRRLVSLEAGFAHAGERRARNQEVTQILGAVAVRVLALFVPTQEVIKLRARMEAGKIDTRELYPITRGTADLDKIQRNVGDALVDAGVIKDDSQVVDWFATKRYAPNGHGPSCLIEVVELP